MHENLSSRMLAPLRVHSAGVDLLVYVAFTHPHLHLPVGPQALDVGTEKKVRQEEDAAILGNGVDDRHHVPAGAAIVQFGLDLGRRIDVSHRHVVWELGPPAPHVLGGDACRQGAARPQVWEEHALFRGEDGGRLGHEVDAAERDDVSLSRHCLARETQGVTHVVGDVLNLGALVVVGEYHRVAGTGQLPDLVV